MKKHIEIYNMKIVMITGDRNLSTPGTPPYERLMMQKKYADIVPVFWGKGALFAPFKELGAFDVITVQDPFWRGLIGLCVSKYKRTRFNVQLHTDLNAQNLGRRILANIVFRYADSIRVVSSTLKIQLEQMRVHAPVKVLPIFLDIEHLKLFKQNTQPRPRKKILWVGRFEKEKDPMRAIDTLREVIDEGIDAELVMLGIGSLENKLREKSKGLRVAFPGWKDPLEYLVTADVLLNTSHYEGYGAAIIEALAIGVPVVAPDVGVAREAGAIIAPQDNFTSAVVDVLRSNTRGELKMELLSKDDWGRQWKETL